MRYFVLLQWPALDVSTYLLSKVRNDFVWPFAFFCRMPGEQGTRTNYQLSFTGEAPFDEYPVGLTNQKPLRMEDVEELAKEMMAAQQKRR